MTDTRSPELRMYEALKRIAEDYQTPEMLRENADDEYGICPDEAIEMAYENVIWEAQHAIQGVQRPKK